MLVMNMITMSICMIRRRGPCRRCISKTALKIVAFVMSIIRDREEHDGDVHVITETM